jgi:UDP-2-acetamido-2,6-beta-L-arabino-hexul-4-ose reductase
MIKIGITGQCGFVGTHLYNTEGLNPARFERIPFEDGFFTEEGNLHEFVIGCDAIVHLAAMNRHSDPEVIYQTNLALVKQLIATCEVTNSRPHILFSSSTQERQGLLLLQHQQTGKLKISDQ